MAWRVSWAALCNRASCDRPTPNTRNEPRNMQAKPAAMRCETETPVETVCVVMSPSVRPIEMKHYCFTCLSGRSPDLQLHDLNAFPVAQWHMLKPNRSQLRGQSRFRPRLGGPYRVPYYAPSRLANEAPNPTYMAGRHRRRQYESDRVDANITMDRR
jgi:hypothetical protein